MKKIISIIGLSISVSTILSVSPIQPASAEITPFVIDHGNTLLRAYTSPFPEEIDRECRKRMENPPETQIYGCAVVNQNVCIVYATNPGIGYEPMYYFHHEVWHCLFPKWHP